MENDKLNYVADMSPVTVTAEQLLPAAEATMPHIAPDVRALGAVVLQEAWLAFFRQLTAEFLADPNFLRREAGAHWAEGPNTPWRRALEAGDNVIFAHFERRETGSDHHENG